MSTMTLYFSFSSNEMVFEKPSVLFSQFPDSDGGRYMDVQAARDAELRNFDALVDLSKIVQPGKL